MGVSGLAPLASGSSALTSWLSGYALAGIIAALVAIGGGIARFIYILRHHDNPGVGFTQRRRYQNELRRRQEIARQLAQNAAPEDGEPSEVSPSA
jgi:adenylylsulfate kinase-like enzyme